MSVPSPEVQAVMAMCAHHPARLDCLACAARAQAAASLLCELVELCLATLPTEES